MNHVRKSCCWCWMSTIHCLVSYFSAETDTLRISHRHPYVNLMIVKYVMNITLMHLSILDEPVCQLRQQGWFFPLINGQQSPINVNGRLICGKKWPWLMVVRWTSFLPKCAFFTAASSIGNSTQWRLPVSYDSDTNNIVHFCLVCL